jgi:glutamate-5-semialdehyde dehydrogenase
MRDIQPPARFSAGTAILVVFGVIAAEMAIEALLTRAVQFGALLGLLPASANGPEVEPTLLIATKLLGTALVAAWALRRNGESWQAAGRPGFAPAHLVLALLPVVAGITIFLSELDNVMRAVLPAFLMEQLDFAPDLDALVNTSWQGPVLAVVIAPLTEELVFRGLILRGLLGRWRPAIAITASAALFAATHLNPAQAPVAMLLGLVLGWVYVRTRSIGLCMAGHALNNAATYVTDFPFEVPGFNWVPEDAEVIFHPWWFNAAGALLFCGGLWWIHRHTPFAAPWLRPAAKVPVAPEPPVLAPPPLAVGGCQTVTAGESAGSMSGDLGQLVTSLAQRARAASFTLATTPRAAKDAALLRLAALLEESTAELLAANARDLASPEAAALTAAARDRLTLNEDLLRHLAESVRQVAALPDPVGAVLEETTPANGLRLRKVRVPIGVIGIIYESRPNVTIDCAVLCLKSGNAAVLRGGKECFHTNLALAALVQRALAAAGLPADAVQLVPTTDRAALATLLKLNDLIHCIIPRGGEGLIRHVAENSTIPVIKHYKGVCFVYVDAAADLAMAEAVTVNAKVARPSACNAAEQLLVHRSVADRFLPAVGRALAARGVELRCDPAAAAILAREGVAAAAAGPADFTAEFLGLVLAVRVVDSLDEAVATINRDGSGHSDAIITADGTAARRFLAEVDSAAVFWNASTRFNDGFEFGFGAEIGISTDRLHARGPMGLPELCSYKYLVEGTGQIRG